jgi:flagellar biosynthesis repressor protein FlbT
MRISLKTGEKFYINGAVLKADRKVTLELSNSAVFLLEQHILQPEATSTPLRQLYFMVQMMLIEPVNRDRAYSMFQSLVVVLLEQCQTPELLGGIEVAKQLVEEDRLIDALKSMRGLFSVEDKVISNSARPDTQQGHCA